MEVRITGRHAHLGEKVKAYVYEKLGPLSRYYDRTRYLEVVFDDGRLIKKVEVIAHLNGSKPLVATIEHKDALAAIDLAHDKLERLLTRAKERIRNGKLRSRKNGGGRIAAGGTTRGRQGAIPPAGKAEEE